MYSCGQQDNSACAEESRRLGVVRKAAILATIWQVFRTPPGSESGACVYRGNPGTRESLLPPCQRSPEDEGYWEIKSPGIDI